MHGKYFLPSATARAPERPASLVKPDVRIVADKDDVEEDPWIMVFTPEQKLVNMQWGRRKYVHRILPPNPSSGIVQYSVAPFTMSIRHVMWWWGGGGEVILYLF